MDWFKAVRSAYRFYRLLKYQALRKKYTEYTMVPLKEFLSNLELCYMNRLVQGVIVECGVWKGGMSASICEVVGNKREYLLFDSFEGLPEAEEIDGQTAKNWQQNPSTEINYNNCKVNEEFAKRAMQLAKAENVSIIKGWFADTLPKASFEKGISILRLDGDWYGSTMVCLENLFPYVVKGGLIIIDDYYLWPGCTKAVHDYLSSHKLGEKIRQHNNGNVFYIIKGR